MASDDPNPSADMAEASAEAASAIQSGLQEKGAKLVGDL